MGRGRNTPPFYLIILFACIRVHFVQLILYRRKGPYFSAVRLLKKQVWYQTDLDYHATLERLQNSKKFTGLDELKTRGRPPFWLKEEDNKKKEDRVTFQITTSGKLGVYYPEETDISDLLKKVIPFLIKTDSTEVSDIYDIGLENEAVALYKRTRYLENRVEAFVNKWRIFPQFYNWDETLAQWKKVLREFRGQVIMVGMNPVKKQLWEKLSKELLGGDIDKAFEEIFKRYKEPESEKS